MRHSSRIVSALAGAVLLAAAIPPARAAPGGAGRPAADSPLVLAQADGVPDMGPTGAPARPFGFPAPPFMPPLLPAGGVAAPPRCPLIIKIGRGLAHAVRSRIIHGRAACI